ncbi:MAG: ABC transporter substrate-binding protein [Bifidobacteriaceae bacterium]|jgi:peptide/nickel transport system substrate-binding protein|nr:ABC transporter substrate-binding protein [Bifidobacteriaceae bacterium]
MNTPKRALITGLAFLVGAGLALSGCASKRDDTSSGTTTPAATDTAADTGEAQPTEGGETTEAPVVTDEVDPNSVFVFGGSADPVALDPALVTDGESIRVANQIFESLMGYKEGSAEVEPRLATGYTQSEDGLSYTFTLREGVKFHDGTDFNADAVCYNYDRWFNWTGTMQQQNISNYYQLIFEGFKTSDNPDLQDPLYASCTTNGDFEATITLTRPYGGFIAVAGTIWLAIQSPDAMKQYDADNVEAEEGSDVRYGEYATAHPCGTGPFKFDSWEKGQQVTLVRNDDYWGDKAKVAKVIIRNVGDATARMQALQSGEIDAYDMVSPGDLAGLEGAGFQLVPRQPFNILYLGMDQNTEIFKDVRVRQAFNYGIDKEALIAQVLPAGSEAATLFYPPASAGYAEALEAVNAEVQYTYDPDKAKELLEEAGVMGQTIDFYYPTGTSRPYMPNPEEIYVALKSQIEALGMQVNGIPLKWSPEYLEQVKAVEGHSMFIVGSTSSTSSPGLEVFFGTYNIEWGFNNQEIFDLVTSAKGQATAAETDTAYAAASVAIALDPPGVPVAHVPVTVALAPNISGYITYPTGSEIYNKVSVG